MNITVEELISLIKAVRSETFKEAAMEARIAGERHKEVAYRMGLNPTIGGATMAVRDTLLALARGERITLSGAVESAGEKK
jgi:ABC-type molybdenum transport system ATPase subunit/photorepair protein PhrA